MSLIRKLDIWTKSQSISPLITIAGVRSLSSPYRPVALSSFQSFLGAGRVILATEASPSGSQQSSVASSALLDCTLLRSRTERVLLLTDYTQPSTLLSSAERVWAGGLQEKLNWEEARTWPPTLAATVRQKRLLGKHPPVCLTYSDCGIIK